MQNTIAEPMPKEEIDTEPSQEENIIQSDEENPEAKEVETKPEDQGENESAKETEEVDAIDEQGNSEDEDEIVVSIEGEEAPEEADNAAPKWIKDLRKKSREQAREIKKLQAQLENSSEKKDQTIELGKKPTLDDFYGEDNQEAKFEEALTQWHGRKRKLDVQAEEKKQEQQKLEQAYQKKLEAYYEGKAKNKVTNFDELEATVTESLNPDMQSAIIMESDKPDLVVAAIGSNPNLLEKFQAVKNGVELGKLIATTELKMTLKSKSTRKPPPPETTVKGNAGTSGSVKTTLEKLEAEADRTGDRTKLINYKRKLRKSST